MVNRTDSPASATFSQLMDMGFVLLGVVAAMVVGYQFFRNRDNFVIVSCAIICLYAIGMLYITNKTEFMGCLGQDMFTYKLIRFTTMSIIMLSILTSIAAYGTKARGSRSSSSPPSGDDGKGRRR